MTSSYPIAMLESKIKALRKQARSASIKNRWLAADSYSKRADALQRQLDAMKAEAAK